MLFLIAFDGSWWLDDQLPRQRSSSWSRVYLNCGEAAGIQPDFRIHGIPSFSILPFVPFQPLISLFHARFTTHPKTFFHYHHRPSMRLALHADWLIRFRRSWFLYLSPSFSLPRYPVSQRLPADWTRLGRPDNPIEFEFMDIRRRAARVAGLKGRRVTNEYLSRGRELSPEIERRDAISLSAATVSRLHYANRNGEYKFLRIFRADKTLLRLGRKRFKGVWSPTRCLHDECVRKFGWRFRAVAMSEMMDRWFGHTSINKVYLLRILWTSYEEN